MKLSLYSIEQEYLSIAEQLTDNGGELTPELEQALSINEQSLHTKSTNYGLVIKNLEYQNNIIDAEIERLQGLKKTRENAVKRLKGNISEAMKIYGIDKIETPVLKLSFRKSETVEIDNDRLIPSEYWVEKTTATISKTAIKKAIEEGIEVPGAHISVNQNLQIK